MSDPCSVPTLQKLSRRLSRALATTNDSAARPLEAALLRLDRCLLELSRAAPAPPTLWIDDVAAALDAVLRRLLHVSLPHANAQLPLPQQQHDSDSALSASFPSSAPRSPPPSAMLRSRSPSRHDALAPHAHHSQSQSHLHSQSHTHLPRGLSARMRTSFARLLSVAPPAAAPPPRSAFAKAATTVDEWLAAMDASRDDARAPSECVSLSDALPPLPQQYAPCRDTLYAAARDALLRAAVGAPNRARAPAVLLSGRHGVGKTLLASELVADPDVVHHFADGVAWIQLAPAVTDEELADAVIRAVDTIIAGDFRTAVRYASSLHTLFARAARVLRHVACLVVVDDVEGARAERAADLVLAALGPASVALVTAPAESETHAPPQLRSGVLAARLHVPPLEPAAQEAVSVFRGWLTASASEEVRGGTLKHATDQNMIVKRCHGLPLALAMAAGFLSKFHDGWATLAAALSGSASADETIFRVLTLLHSKGGLRFELQLKAVGCLPAGVWVSLSALADIWGMDYKTIKLSARRLGRMAFAEYRLSDSSDESRVRFHWHIVQYCQRVTAGTDEREANRKLLSNVSRRRTGDAKQADKIDFSPWWSGCVTDKYMCRRLHWHMVRADSLEGLRDLVCDYLWVCHRLEKDSLLGVITDFKLAIAAEEREGRTAEAEGLTAILSAVQEAVKLFKEEALEMSALPTFFFARLAEKKSGSESCRDFLTSVFEKARRPWLKPAAAATATAEASLETMSTESSESEMMPYLGNCLASSASGKVVCGDRIGNIRVHDPVTGANVMSWASASVGGASQWRGVGALATIHDYVVSGHFNGRVMLRSMRTGQVQRLFESDESNERVTALAANEHGAVAVGTFTGSVHILKGVTEMGCSPRRVQLEGHCNMVTTLYIFPDGERLASSSYDGFAAIWSLRGDGDQERISLNGHKPDIGHKENYITTFAAISGGKRLLSSCRGGVVSAWNSTTGQCLWTRRSGFEFSRSASLQAFGARHFSSSLRESSKAVNMLRVGSPYLVTLGESPGDLLILAAGEREVLGTVSTEQVISSWLELWHPGSQKIFVAVSHVDGQLTAYELVTSLR